MIFKQENCKFFPKHLTKCFGNDIIQIERNSPFTIGASNANGDMAAFSAFEITRARYAMRAPIISAPGVNMMMPLVNDSGTSYATPVVSGIVARLAQRRPTLLMQPEKIKAILMASATPLNGQGNYWSAVAGAGRVSYARAVAIVTRSVGNAVLFDVPNALGMNITANLNPFVGGATSVRMVSFWMNNSSTSSRPFLSIYNRRNAALIPRVLGDNYARDTNIVFAYRAVYFPIYASFTVGWSVTRIQENGGRIRGAHVVVPNWIFNNI